MLGFPSQANILWIGCSLFALVSCKHTANPTADKDASPLAGEILLGEESTEKPQEPATRRGLFGWSQMKDVPEEHMTTENIESTESAPTVAIDMAVQPIPSTNIQAREPGAVLAPTNGLTPGTKKPGDPIDTIGLYPKDE